MGDGVVGSWVDQHVGRGKRALKLARGSVLRLGSGLRGVRAWNGVVGLGGGGCRCGGRREVWVMSSTQVTLQVDKAVRG